MPFGRRRVTRFLQSFFMLTYPLHRGEIAMSRCLPIAYVGGMNASRLVALATGGRGRATNDNEPDGSNLGKGGRP